MRPRVPGSEACTMTQRLELIREKKLFRLLPGATEASRLEASGVALADDSSVFVCFDNLNQVARIDISLNRGIKNPLFPTPSLGLGFEDIATDLEHGRVFCLIETLEDFNGALHGFVAEYDIKGRFIRCARLDTRFERQNKGFEGLAHVRLRGREHLYALCEDNLGKRGKRGRIDVFERAKDGSWKPFRQIHLPKQAEFEDYAALAYRGGKIAVVSQESARLWVAKIDEKERNMVPRSSAIYRFPNKSYGNVEGIAWLAPDTLLAVSDRKKATQPSRCSEKDQSIHIFRIPAH
jgi:hypothetical protein